MISYHCDPLCLLQSLCIVTPILRRANQLLVTSVENHGMRIINPVQITFKKERLPAKAWHSWDAFLFHSMAKGRVSMYYWSRSKVMILETRDAQARPARDRQCFGNTSIGERAWSRMERARGWKGPISEQRAAATKKISAESRDWALGWWMLLFPWNSVFFLSNELVSKASLFNRTQVLGF